jgi:hypothetical protein
LLGRFRNLFIPLGTVLALLSLHEFGHLWASWATGGRVSEIAILSLTPHVQVLGAGSRIQEAFRAAAGSGASLLACFGFMAYGGGRSLAWRLARVTAWAFGMVELTGWCLSLIAHSPAPDPDDAARFLSVSSIGAPQVLAACGVIAVALIAAFRRAARRADRRRRVELPPPATPVATAAAAK